ncbi:MAG: Wzz/FepE/Etk N-terminal domain-containing protein [Pigmentiphaga sp.]|uniref:Chain length determinant protein EpsF n=1 Tax=Pigmentiphaga daeguensis TaxID=414049 RepID=A0ABP3LUF4_9BURK
MNQTPARHTVALRSPIHDDTLISFNQILAMLKARRRLILVVLSMTILCCGLAVLLLPRTWTASTDIYIDTSAVDSRLAAPIGMFNEGYAQVQIDMLTSQRVADKAIDQLGWRQGADYAAQVARHGKSDADALLITKLTKNTEIISGRGSQLLTLMYRDQSPATARDAANAIVQAYISVSQDLATSSARNRFEQYEHQIDQLRNETNTIQADLTRFKQEAGILSNTEESDLSMQRLQSQTSALAMLQNQRLEAQAQAANARRLISQGIAPAELPGIAQLPTIQDLKSAIVAIQRKLNEARSTYGPRHPTMLALQAELEQSRVRLAREAQTALDGMLADDARLASQEQGLRQDLAAAQADVLKRKGQRDRIADYERQLASVQQIYNSALQKYDSLLFASQSTLTNISVMRPADLPSEPSSPKVMRSLAASAVVGLLLGVGLALMLELATRRIRCPEDLMRSTHLPLLASIGKTGADGRRKAR